MGGGKETPRQKMVGLMYLVLMALLAMNVSKEIINAFVTLNNKIEGSITNTESFNEDIIGNLDSKYATLVSTSGKNNPETIRVLGLINVKDSIVYETRKMCNDLVARNLWMLVGAADASTLLEEFQGIELAIIDPDNNPDAVSKLKAVVEKINGLGIIANDGEVVDHADDPYHNDLFHITDDGFIHIKDLAGYTKKDDYDTPTRMLAGQDFEHVAPEGAELMKNLHNFRNKICQLIADKPGEIVVEENGEKVSKKINYVLDTAFINDPELLSNEAEKVNFAQDVANRVDSLAALNQIDKQDAETLKSIWQRLTIQKFVLNHGEKYPWIFGQFDHAPIVAATAVMTSLRSDVLSVQTLATQLIDDRVKVNTFDFNKIEPLAFSASSYINQGDSVGLKVMIAAYDSTEAMKIRYWEDDSSEYVKPHGSRDKSNMKTFNGNAGDQLNITGGVGDHTLYGEIAVKVKGSEKWKPWRFNYSVGAPNAAISAADLQVLYINWKNKLRVSASGYKPEAIRVKGIGCSVSSKPDGKGFYIATVSNVRAKTARLIVEATADDGSTAKLADETFRVFPLPKPIAKFANKAGGNLKKANAVSYSTIKANLGDSPLNVPYKVVAFKLFTTKNGQPIEYSSKSNRLTGEMKAAVKKIPKGGSLTFTGIDVINETNGKKTRLESGIVLKLI